ncbi:hypothetical protein [Halostreptopolyspora alba]|uniref:DUF3311 domain-containing protein n=1 Tax=Halostreptopolyspora alba TaxID=2487137 RepID=A0A3N0E8H4_9ACTN|nr:hypothetical protein EFW17_12995 [Nocardiopsaceae bacterium YIM 96095]
MNRPSPRQPREPIRKPWIWVVLAAIILVSVPWYWPPETIHPIVFGLPLWSLVTLAGSVVLCGFLSWVCRTQWETPDDGEED